MSPGGAEANTRKGGKEGLGLCGSERKVVGEDLTTRCECGILECMDVEEVEVTSDRWLWAVLLLRAEFEHAHAISSPVGLSKGIPHTPRILGRLS